MLLYCFIKPIKKETGFIARFLYLYKMRILFDIWILDPSKIDNMSFEEQTFLETLFSFVDERLIILEDEINKEEASKKEGDCVIIIEILNKRIAYHGYSNTLTEKMKNCFTEKDSIILSQRLEKAFNYLN